MDEIERRTNGHWRPSPGSVYPLLAWLQDNGYIKHVQTEGAEVKRYILTEEGKRFLKEQRKIRIQLAIRRGMLPLLLASPSLSTSKETKDLQRTLRKFFKAILSLNETLEEKFSEQILKEMLEILNETSQKLEEMRKKLKS